MKPEWHISYTEDGCYKAGVKEAKESGKYIKGSISVEDVGICCKEGILLCSF